MKLPRIALELLLFLMLLAGGCARVTPAPTPTAEPSPTQAPVDWILGYGDDGLSLYDLLGGARTDLVTPTIWLPEIDIHDDAGLTGNGLLAVRTISDRVFPDDLSLTILRLPDGGLIKQIPLLSQRLSDRISEEGGSGGPVWQREDTYLALFDRWTPPHWSPDGNTLAFTAALDGPSTDVHLYDVARDEVRRLTQEPDQAVILGWSPDGQWLVYLEAYDFGYSQSLDAVTAARGYQTLIVHAISPDSGRIVDLLEPLDFSRAEVVRWLPSGDLILSGVDLIEGFRELYGVNLERQTADLLFYDVMQSVDVDPQSEAIVITTWEDSAGHGNIYFLKSGEELAPLSGTPPDFFATRVSWVPALDRFFAESFGGVESFTSSGSDLRTYPDETCLPVPSGDGQWLAFWGCEYGGGLRIYPATSDERSEVDTGVVQDLAWSPDSDRLYFLSNVEGDTALSWVAPGGNQATRIDDIPRPRLAMIELKQGPVEIARPLLTPAPARRRLAPSPTPVLGLNPTGPWLAGLGPAGVIAMNQDGTGTSAVFPEVDLGDRFGVANLWWAAEMSSTGWVGMRVATGDASRPLPHLLLARLPSIQPIEDLPILSADLISKLSTTGEDGTQAAWDDEAFVAIHLDGEQLGLSWSPDGRLLAFVAAMDGPSADIYIYDTATDETRRLTDGPNQSYLLGWSPDSRWVMHQEISDFHLGPHDMAYEVHGLWATAADGSGSRLMAAEKSPMFIAEWLSPTQFAAKHYPVEDEQSFSFTLVDLDAAQEKTLYPGDFVNEWAADPLTHALAFVVGSEFGVENTRTPGLYLTTLAGSPRLIGFEDPPGGRILGVVADLKWSPELDLFLVETFSDGIYGVSTEGEIVRQFQGGCGMPLVSPNGQWLAFHSCDPQFGIRLHSEQDGSDRQLTDEPFFDMFWAPDSSGLYYFQGETPSRLMFVLVPDGPPRLIHPDPGFYTLTRPPTWVGIP